MHVPQFVVILHEHVQFGDLLVLGSDLGDSSINMVFRSHEAVVLGLNFVNNTLGVNVVLEFVPVDL